MRTCSTLLSGKVVMPFESGAAKAAVANSALAPAAREMANFFIVFSGLIVSISQHAQPSKVPARRSIF
jgi:hypothetical protein